jgi:sugar phosphate isomerase/epimerase
VNTLAEAVSIVGSIGSPAIGAMFDTHNGADETEPHDVIVDRHFDMIRHAHVNGMDGRQPGTGSYDFKPLLRTLAARNLGGWVSLEVFDFLGWRRADCHEFAALPGSRDREAGRLAEPTSSRPATTSRS